MGVMGVGGMQDGMSEAQQMMLREKEQQRKLQMRAAMLQNQQQQQQQQQLHAQKTIGLMIGCAVISVNNYLHDFKYNGWSEPRMRDLLTMESHRLDRFTSLGNGQASPSTVSWRCWVCSHSLQMDLGEFARIVDEKGDDGTSQNSMKAVTDEIAGGVGIKQIYPSIVRRPTSDLSLNSFR